MFPFSGINSGGAAKINTDYYCICFILGSIVSLGFGPLSFIKILGLGLLDFFDFISNSVLMPIVAILTCICVGHFVGAKVISDEVELKCSI